MFVQQITRAFKMVLWWRGVGMRGHVFWIVSERVWRVVRRSEGRVFAKGSVNIVVRIGRISYGKYVLGFLFSFSEYG